MTSHESNTVLHLFISNEKGLINTDNASSKENLTITTKASSSLLYSNKRKNNSLVRKITSETMAKKTSVFHAKKDNPI